VGSGGRDPKVGGMGVYIILSVAQTLIGAYPFALLFLLPVIKILTKFNKCNLKYFSLVNIILFSLLLFLLRGMSDLIPMAGILIVSTSACCWFLNNRALNKYKQ
jgi:hypothetical protein